MERADDKTVEHPDMEERDGNDLPVKAKDEKAPRRPGPKGLRAMFFRSVTLAGGSHEEVERLNEGCAIVYVLEQPSRTDLACLCWKYLVEGLPAPERTIGRNPEKDGGVVEPGRPRALLLGKDSDVERLAALLRLARGAPYPVKLVPQVVLYERKPAKAGAPSWWDALMGPGGRPKLTRKWYSLLRSGGKAILSAVDPIDLKEFAGRPEVAGLPDNAAARMLLDTLRMIFREERRVVMGPHLPQRERMKNMVRRHPNLVEAVREEAERTGKAEWEVWNEVDRHLEEMMADYNISYIRFWEKILSWVWKRFFNGISVDYVGLERARRAVRKGPVIYVPNHRSHTDYLLVSYVLFTNNMTPPHIAAGNNLNFWPLGHLFRKSGAFFMKRSFQQTGVYRTVFECYLRTLVREGFNVEFFIEGGRSRSGKLFLPKMGVLGMLIRAFEEGELPDLYVAPIAISYDRLPEEDEILRDSQASDEKLTFFGAMRQMLKRNFGRIHVNFAPPISMKEFLRSQKAEPSSMDVESRRALYRDFAFRVIHSINQVAVVTPVGLMASSLLGRASPGLEEEALLRDARLLAEYVRAAGIRMAPTLHHPDAALSEALRIFRLRREVKEVSVPGDRDDKLLVVDPEKRPGIEYYKNNALHALFKPAFVATSLLACGERPVSSETIETDYSFMMKVFKYEFVYDADWPVKRDVERVMDIFGRWGLVEQVAREEGVSEKKAWAITPKGRDVLPVFSGQVENFLEAYLYTLEDLPEICGDELLETEKLAKKLLQKGYKAYHLGRIKRRESVSRVTFGNALSMAAHIGLIERVKDEEGASPRWRICSDKPRVGEEYTKTLRRLARIR